VAMGRQPSRLALAQVVAVGREVSFCFSFLPTRDNLRLAQSHVTWKPTAVEQGTLASKTPPSSLRASVFVPTHSVTIDYLLLLTVE